ncbi:MAG: ABC transporter permease subunit, partial [Armatimonadetes bacterium]|nr:ABC transporter permease subunit [Anaerolineae bacterium]
APAESDVPISSLYLRIGLGCVSLFAIALALSQRAWIIPILESVIVAATLGIAGSILAESYISFLGLGVRPPTATWGNMLESSRDYIDDAPWLWLAPGILILLTVLSINFVGDGLRDALDPRSDNKV